MPRTLALLIAGLAATACSEPPADDVQAESTDEGTAPVVDSGPTVPLPEHACYDGAPALSLAQGATFVPTEEGAPMTLVHGPQGGWHLELAGLTEGHTDIVSIAATITVVSTGEVLAGDQQATRQALVGWSESDCSGEFGGIVVYADDQPGFDIHSACALDGEALEVDVTVTDLSDPYETWQSHQQQRFTLALDPVDVDFCTGA